MLQKAQRLTTYQIERAKKKGKVYQYPLFGVSIFDRAEDGLCRFGVVVSKKITKAAVERNRLKRIILETVRYEAKHMTTGMDVVFLLKRNVIGTPTDKIMSEVKRALKKEKIITK